MLGVYMVRNGRTHVYERGEHEVVVAQHILAGTLHPFASPGIYTPTQQSATYPEALKIPRKQTNLAEELLTGRRCPDSRRTAQRVLDLTPQLSAFIYTSILHVYPSYTHIHTRLQ